MYCKAALAVAVVAGALAAWSPTPVAVAADRPLTVMPADNPAAPNVVYVDDHHRDRDRRYYYYGGPQHRYRDRGYYYNNPYPYSYYNTYPGPYYYYPTYPRHHHRFFFRFGW